MRTKQMSWKLSVVSCLALLLSGLQVASAKGPSGLSSPAREPDPSMLVPDGRINLRTGVPEALYGVGYEVTADTPEAMARQYLRENAARLGLRDASLADLTHLRTQKTLIGHTVRFQQWHEGIEVSGGRIAVTINQASTVVFVANEYKPDIALETTTALVTETAAAAVARNLLQVGDDLNHEESKLVVDYDRGISRLVFRSRIVPRSGPIGDWEILTDARTGAVLSVVDRAAYGTFVAGDGNVFDPDPLSTATVSYGTAGYVDGGDANTPELDAELINVVLPEITLDGGMHRLEGPRTRIVDAESPFKGLFEQASSSFTFNRNEDGFEAVNVYYHVDHYMAYLNETLGLGVVPTLNGGLVQFDPHGLSGSDNSHYISSTELIAFGEGGVDDAEDADVVIHELGHGLHDWAAGCISQSNGLSEGIGDYVAEEYSRTRSINAGLWNPSDPEWNWVFGWDGHNPFWGGRVTNWTDTNTWPSGTSGFCLHTCGQYWASSMMDIYDAIGRDNTARAHWVGIAMTGCSATHIDAANAVIQAAIDLGFSSSDVNTIWDVFANNTGYPVAQPDFVIFTDGFESGDTASWSSVTP